MKCASQCGSMDAKLYCSRNFLADRIFISFLHTNAFVDLSVVVIKCHVNLCRQPMSKVMLPAVDLLSQVQTWTAPQTLSVPALTWSRRSLLSWACTDCGGPCTHHSHPCDLHVGDTHKPAADPRVGLGHGNPAPAPQAEAFIPTASLSSRNPDSHVHLYSSARGAVLSLHVHNFPLIFLRFMYASREENGPLWMF